MRVFILIAALIMLCVLSIQVIAQDGIDEAQLAYDAGNYEAAISLYEFALLNDADNGALYINLGHAYYMAGQSGKALQTYLQAEHYLPRHKILSEQIELIRRERNNTLIGQADWVTTTYNLTANYLTVSELSIIIFGLWIVWFIMLGVALKRNGWWIPLILIGLILFISIGLLGTRLYLDNERPIAVILVDEVQVKSGPDASFLDLFTLYEANELRVVERRDGWVRFVLVDGRQGWILEDSFGYVG